MVIIVELAIIMKDRTEILRSLLIHVTAAASVLAFCSCGGKDENSAASEAEADPRSKVVRVITWEDYLAPEAVESFEEQTGLKLEIDTFENTEDLIGTLRAYSNKYDVVIFDSSSVDRFSKM